MADIRGSIKLAATVVGLAVLCVLAYYLLLYLVSPHPQQVYPGGYFTAPYNTSNYTGAGGDNEIVVSFNATIPPEDNNVTFETVSFFELPLWIQLYALPGILFGILGSIAAAAFFVRHASRKDNHNKRGVFAFISKSPGCTAPEVARERHMNIGTARYHIQQLQDEGRIILEKIGKYSRIFVNSHTYDDREKRIASHLHSEPSFFILKTLLEAPGASNQALSEKLGMEKSLVYRYMQKFVEDGIVTFEWEGRNKLYYIDTSAKETLIKLMPLHYQCPGLKKE